MVKALRVDTDLRFSSHATVMFATIKWLHTWYNPRVDGTPHTLAVKISSVSLRGIYSPAQD
jgi:hypothetical protein